MSKPVKRPEETFTPDEARLMSELCKEWLEWGVYVPGGPYEHTVEQVRAKCERLAKARRA